MLSLNGFSQESDPQLTNISDTITLSDHPISNLFSLRSNKLVVNQRSKQTAGTFDDPSRVLYRYPSAAITNDQNNAISYRGLPPGLIKWSCYGAEVVSPNHLSNAGTISDGSSISSGGVLGIPIDVINSLSFSGNPSGSEVVSAISGNFDFDFDKPSENFFKVGLLGIEAGMQSTGKSQTKAHVRYSTVGLLSDFGLDFNGESIKFYDAFFQTKPINNVIFFASAGRSTNNRAIDSLGISSATIRDVQNVNYASQYIIAGLRVKHKSFSHSLAYSFKENDRRATLLPEYDNEANRDYLSGYDEHISKLSYHLKWKHKLKFGTLYAGNIYTFSKPQKIELFRFSSAHTGLIPYIGLDFYKNKDAFDFYIKANTGYNSLANDVQYNFDAGISKSIFTLSLSLSKKHAASDLILDVETVEDYSFSLKINSDKLMFLLRYFNTNANITSQRERLILNRSFIASNEQYYQLIENLGIDTFFITRPNFQSNGFEFVLEKNLLSGFYLNVTGSVFDAKYGRSTQNPIDDYGYIFNYMISKAFNFKKNKSLNLNLSFHQRGGAYNFSPTEDRGNIVFTSRQLSAYSRVDMRLEYNWNNTNRLILDIQNLTNRLNDAFEYFDPISQEVILEKQLGMIPILSYRKTL